jgi:nucleoside-diphosphate-sugar epimerase
MRLLITGGAGFVGSSLARLFNAEWHGVFAWLQSHRAQLEPVFAG